MAQPRDNGSCTRHSRRTRERNAPHTLNYVCASARHLPIAFRHISRALEAAQSGRVVPNPKIYRE